MEELVAEIMRKRALFEAKDLTEVSKPGALAR